MTAADSAADDRSTDYESHFDYFGFGLDRHAGMDMAHRQLRDPIAPAAVRYIKLGPANAWFESSRGHQRLEFGHPDVSDRLARSGDRTGIASVYTRLGKTQSKASDYAREVSEFYSLGADCLWVTFAEGSLWWGFAKPAVHMLQPTSGAATRYRELLFPWRNRDVCGNLLSVATLITRLTTVAAYRQTLCAVKSEQHLIRRINGVEEPIVAETRSAQERLVRLAETLIRNLHWRDFEVLCDLMLARSGWQRIAELGGLQRGTDLVIEQIATGERAFVQVKSSADQKTLQRYVADFEVDGAFDRMFFICHSPAGPMQFSSRKPVHVWAGETIARQAIAAGLINWLMQKAG